MNQASALACRNHHQIQIILTMSCSVAAMGTSLCHRSKVFGTLGFTRKLTCTKMPNSAELCLRTQAKIVTQNVRTLAASLHMSTNRGAPAAGGVFLIELLRRCKA